MLSSCEWIRLQDPACCLLSRAGQEVPRVHLQRPRELDLLRMLSVVAAAEGIGEKGIPRLESRGSDSNRPITRKGKETRCLPDRALPACLPALLLLKANGRAPETCRGARHPAPDAGDHLPVPCGHPPLPDDAAACSCRAAQAAGLGSGGGGSGGRGPRDAGRGCRRPAFRAAGSPSFPHGSPRAGGGRCCR